MYKLIIYDSLENVLDQEYYLIKPSENVICGLLIAAWRRFQVKVNIKVESVKYSEMGKAS